MASRDWREIEPEAQEAADKAEADKLNKELESLPEEERALYQGMNKDQRVQFWANKAEEKRRGAPPPPAAAQQQQHGRLVLKEEMAVGTVPWSSYLDHFQAMGGVKWLTTDGELHT